MKKLFTILVPLTIGILLTATGWAQSPEKMSYQAVIRNSSNVLVANQAVGIQITILKDSASGTAVYVETQTPTTNANGLVSMEIGGGILQSGDFSTIDWSKGPYFLKTETDPEGGTSYTIIGISQLLSVPYALYAKEAGNVPDVTGIAINTQAIQDTAKQIRSDMFKGNMANQNITNLANPSNTQDAATKAYIDNITKILYQKKILSLEDLVVAGLHVSDLIALGVEMVGTLEQIGADSSELVDAGLIGSITDSDNNLYKWVRIGEQYWMAENLKTTRYADGIPIQEVTGFANWDTLTATDAAYCWYNNDSATYAGTYGALYTWAVVNTNKLCPAGWHVPMNDEWTTLFDYLGGKELAGDKLKETGTVHWESPNYATNETGFTALPGGNCNEYGYFDYLGIAGGWWTASENTTDKAWRWRVYNQWVEIYNFNDIKEIGFSVRCLRD